MSPRGVYDRSGTGSAPKKSKTEKVTAGGGTMKKTNNKKSEISALPTANNLVERFSILRENITTLAHVRSSLSAVDAVAKQADQEIIQHVSAITQLRKQAFGLTHDEQQVVDAEKIAGQNAVARAIPVTNYPSYPNLPA